MSAAMPQHTQGDAQRAFIPTADPTGQAYAYYHGYVNLDPAQPANANSSTDLNTAYGNASEFGRTALHYGQYGLQTNQYLQQPETLIPLSGGSFMGSSLSPSTSNEQFSPEAFLSESYSSPNLEERFLDGQYPQIETIQNGSLQSNPPFGSLQAQSGQLNHFGNGFAGSNSYVSSNVLSPAHIPSPQSTHRSSPVIGQHLVHPQTSNSHMSLMKSEGVFAAPLFQHMSSTLDRQQPSPALTNSSTAVSSSDLSSNPHLVVTVDDCVEDNQSHVYLSRSMSKRSHGSRNKGFLSPNVEQDSTDDDSEVNEVSVFSPALDTGLNLRSSQNVIPERGGIAPDDRDSLNTNSMPTLEEMEEQRHISEKNADVVDWLTHSEVGSDAEGEPKRNRRKKPKGRPRARSTNDAALAHTKFSVGVSNPKFDDSLIPGPGLYLNEQSEMGEEYDTESEESDSPAAPFSLVEDSYFPQTASSSGIQNRNNGRPSHTEDHDVQGITSNLAIMRFRQRAKEVDNASLTATIGSRRRSESDIASVVNSVGVSKLLLSPVPVKDERKGGRRRGSFLENILPTRNNSNKMKRKNSQQSDAIAQGPSPKEGQNIMGAPKRIGSFGRPKSPRVDTNLSANGGEVRSPGGVAAGAFAHAKQIWRSRSRSELAKSPKGLADLWTQSGGPPMPTLASPLNSRPTPQPLGGRDCEDDSADDETNGVDGIAMDLSVRTDMQIIPTYDGFKYQARQLNPRLTDFLLERVTQEQVKRYKRLIDLKLRHSQMVSTRSCASKTFCFSLNGESKSLPPRPGNKDPGATLVGFQILAPGMTEDNLEVTGESQTVAAQFPSGVPLPPVKFLPAEFECPLCFKVKKFYKPSDWTKHVHEDVQPFTCTFSGCNEPKSFKRKADWVRHENERHRQLESWTCNVGDCTHTCYRKDNFVQHLVREHKAPEPKVRTGRSGGTKSPATPMDSMQSWQTNLGFVDENIDDVWALVDKCHKDDIKHPEDEPCKFCGNICSSWKKLTVHLAKHMEQITMPVLVLVEQKRVAGDNELLLGTNPRQTVPVMPTKPMADLPIFLCDEPADMEMDTPGIAVNGVSNMLHSYPPSMTGFQSIQANYSSPAESYAGSSYPAPSSSSRARAASFNDSLTLSRQGTTFPPAGMPSTSMQFDNQQNYIQNPGFMIARGMNNSYLTPTSGSAQEYRNKFRYQS